MSFFERLEGLCHDAGFDVSNIGQHVKVDGAPIGRSTVNSWRDGTVKPRPATIKAIADHFHVDVSWLLNGEPHKSSNPFSSIDELLPLTSQEVEIIKVFRNASELGKMRIIAQLMKVWEQDQ